MIIETADGLDRFLLDLCHGRSEGFAFDTETEGITPAGCVPVPDEALVLDRARITMASFCGQDVKGIERSCCTPIREVYGPKFMSRIEFARVVRKYSESKLPVYFHNANYDLNVLANHGITVSNPCCTQVEGRCWNENIAGSLKERAVLIGLMLRKTRALNPANLLEFAEYAEFDAIATWRLKKMHDALPDSEFVPENRRIYEIQERPLIPVILAMERRGMYADKEYFRVLGVEIETELRRLETQIYAVAGRSFNLNSPRQVADTLYGHLGIPEPPKKDPNAKHASTDYDTLFFLIDAHPIVPLFLEYRSVDKLHSTYLSPEQGIVAYCDRDSRIHSTVNQTGAVTFRCSSSKPNLQNIPARSEYGKRIRRGFTAPPRKFMIDADFGLFELVMMANFCLDPVMVKTLSDPSGDIHRTTAEAVNVSRTIAKTLNFGLLYGMGPNKLHKELLLNAKPGDAPVTLQEARAYHRGFFDLYQGVKLFQNRIIEFHRQHGYIQYISRRYRRIPATDSAVQWKVHAAERELNNNIIQGSCADWMKQAMLRIEHDTKLKQWGFELVMQVHDEIIGYCPDNVFIARNCRERIVQLMKEPVDNPLIPITVPIRVSAGIGRNWKDAH